MSKDVSNTDSGKSDVIRLRKEESEKLNAIAELRQRAGDELYTPRMALNECIESHGLVNRKTTDLDLLLLVEELNNRVQQLIFINAELKKSMVIMNLGVVSNLKKSAEQILESPHSSRSF